MKKINSYDELIIILSVKSCIILSMTRTCSVCNIIKEKLKAIEFLYPNIEFFEIYLEDLPIFRGQYLIFSVPTVSVFQNEKEIFRESRFININKLTNILDNILKEH